MSVHLFPHSYLSEAIAKNIVSLFGPIKMHIPWFMDPPPFIGDISIVVSNPPENLKPKDAFKTILSEYRHWVEQNRDRSYLEIIKSDRDNKLTDNTTWEIRQMLGRAAQSLSGTEDDKAIRWHLLLHLAKDVEEQCVEADQILKTLKDKSSPLEGSVEKAGDVKGFLGGLSGFGPESAMNGLNLNQIVEAWFGLFGGYLKENDLLITFNRQVMEYLLKEWDALFIRDRSENMPPIRFNVPDLSHHAPDRQDEIKRGYNLDERLSEIKDLLAWQSPADNLAALEKISKELEGSFPWELSDRTSRYSLKYFCPVSDKKIFQGEEILEKLSGKTIVLIEV